ncbi:hypothetical protein GGR56DRAFT_679008 [Xylariaceae sp. FL0804]|nr:hypothetical protein GGR56DRAFT_679008 [Xylariaceae sp. FL0804]
MADDITPTTLTQILTCACKQAAGSDQSAETFLRNPFAQQLLCTWIQQDRGGSSGARELFRRASLETREPHPDSQKCRHLVVRILQLWKAERQRKGDRQGRRAESTETSPSPATPPSTGKNRDYSDTSGREIHRQGNKYLHPHQREQQQQHQNQSEHQSQNQYQDEDQEDAATAEAVARNRLDLARHTHYEARLEARAADKAFRSAVDTLNRLRARRGASAVPGEQVLEQADVWRRRDRGGGGGGGGGGDMVDSLVT